MFKRSLSWGKCMTYPMAVWQDDESCIANLKWNHPLKMMCLMPFGVFIVWNRVLIALEPHFSPDFPNFHQCFPDVRSYVAINGMDAYLAWKWDKHDGTTFYSNVIQSPCPFCQVIAEKIQPAIDDTENTYLEEAWAPSWIQAKQSFVLQRDASSLRLDDDIYGGLITNQFPPR